MSYLRVRMDLLTESLPELFPLESANGYGIRRRYAPPPPYGRNLRRWSRRLELELELDWTRTENVKVPFLD